MIRLSLLFLVMLNTAFCQVENRASVELVERIDLKEVIKPGRKVLEAAGKFYVLSGYSVYCFDEEGQLLGTFGSRGTGPGEFVGVRDFLVTPIGQVLVGGWTAGNKGKISIFDQDGIHLKDHVVPYMVNQVFFHAGRLFFTTRDVVFHSLKNKHDRFDHLTLDLFEVGDPEPILTLPDKSQINPPHFSGKAYPFPWFAGPYPNSIFILNLDGDFFVFQGKKEFIVKLHGGIKTEIPFQFALPKTTVTKEDIQKYFDRIESVNELKIKETIKRKIEFPTMKNSFSSVRLWDRKFVLFRKESLMVISPDGELLAKVQTPIEFIEHEDQANGNRLGPICLSKDFVYALSDDGVLSKYKWPVMSQHID